MADGMCMCTCMYVVCVCVYVCSFESGDLEKAENGAQKERCCRHIDTIACNHGLICLASIVCDCVCVRVFRMPYVCASYV